jgi:aspartate racemase
MKTIGLIGGMSWESTTSYYSLLNRGIQQKLGGFHSAEIVMVSVNFQPLEEAMRLGNWDQCQKILVENAQRIEAAGADFLLLCTNTMHKVAPAITQAINIPFLHIADATGKRIKKSNIHTIGLLGTSFTMEEDFYRQRLADKHNLKVIIPSPEDRKIVHDIIFNELCRGKIKKQSKDEYLRIINEMKANGAQGVIEGCTEIGMLIKQHDTAMPLFDTTTLHVEQAIQTALTE